MTWQEQRGNMILHFCSVLLTVLQSGFKRTSNGDISSWHSMKWYWSWMRLKQKREGISTCEALFQKVFMFFLKPFSGRSDDMNVSCLFVFIWTFGWGVYPSWQAHNMDFGAVREKMRDIGDERGGNVKVKTQAPWLRLYHFSCSSPLFNNMPNPPKMCCKITIIPLENDISPYSPLWVGGMHVSQITEDTLGCWEQCDKHIKFPIPV